MGRACSSNTYGERGITYQDLVRRHESHKPLGRFRYVWWNKFKIYLKGVLYRPVLGSVHRSRSVGTRTSFPRSKLARA